MAKGQKATQNLLRVAGILFSIAGVFHVLRYFYRWTFRVEIFELTYLGSLILGLFLILLAAACFKESC